MYAVGKVQNDIEVRGLNKAEKGVVVDCHVIDRSAWTSSKAIPDWVRLIWIWLDAPKVLIRCSRTCDKSDTFFSSFGH
jgi:hypothetical protein